MTLRPEHIEEALNKKTFDEIDPDEVLKHYGYIMFLKETLHIRHL